MRSELRLTVALLVLSFGSGCWVHHLDRNAPGEVDIHEKPTVVEDRDHPDGMRPPEVGERIPPRDPGERAVSLLAGPYFTAGIGNSDFDGLFQLGAEVSVVYRELEKSHTNDYFPTHADFLLGDEPVYSGNLGWNFVDWGQAERDSEIGALYAEGQVRLPVPLVLAAGYSVEPDTGRNGPQVTVSPFGMNWLRFNYNWDGSFAISYGVTFKMGHFFVWSR